MALNRTFFAAKTCLFVENLDGVGGALLETADYGVLAALFPQLILQSFQLVFLAGNEKPTGGLWIVQAIQALLRYSDGVIHHVLFQIGHVIVGAGRKDCLLYTSDAADD